jgi:methylated-DNA-[protein]-cysteine S-methyltransferase
MQRDALQREPTKEELFLGTVPSPVGVVRVVASARWVYGVYLPSQEVPHGSVPGSSELLRRALSELQEYFGGTRQTFDWPLHADGTPFQRLVWAQLSAIPFGATRSYADIASALGRPTASRAVGAANGQNPHSIVVPCHRVLGKSGKLTGYAGGVAQKAWLLAHEAKTSAS